MKRFLATMVALLALVFMANTAFAQSSADDPYPGATHTYTVTGLTAGDSVRFDVTNPGQDFDGTVTGTVTLSPSTGFVLGVGETTASVDITWGSGLTVGDQYWVWIEVADSTNNPGDPWGCYNYRYVPVTITENQWDVDLNVVAIGDSTTTPTLTTVLIDQGDTYAECASPDANTTAYNDTTTTDDGRSFIYYEVARDVTYATHDSLTWSFQFDVTGLTNPVAYTSVDAGTSWQAYTLGSTFTVADAANVVDDVYVRVGFDLQTSSITVAADIDNGGANLPSEEDTGFEDSDETNNDISFDINPLPVIGGFSGTFTN